MIDKDSDDKAFSFVVVERFSFFFRAYFLTFPSLLPFKNVSSFFSFQRRGVVVFFKKKKKRGGGGEEEEGKKNSKKKKGRRREDPTTTIIIIINIVKARSLVSRVVGKAREKERERERDPYLFFSAKRSRRRRRNWMMFSSKRGQPSSEDVLRTQIRAQAREIASLQRGLVELRRENAKLSDMDKRPLMEKFKDNLKQLGRDTEWFKLTKIDEEITVNTYRSKTDAKFDLIKQPATISATFPELQNAKITIETSSALPIRLEMNSQPFRKEILSVKAKFDLQRLFGLNNGPTLVVQPTPSAFQLNRETKWNPTLEKEMDIDNVHVVGKYNIVNDSVSLDHVDFEATTTHKDDGQFRLKKVSHHTMMEETKDVDADGYWQLKWKLMAKHGITLTGDATTKDGGEVEARMKKHFSKKIHASVGGRALAQEVDATIGYQFIDELAGWEVIAKSVATRDGVQNPEFILNHAWEFKTENV